ncbi:hypothetical protein EDC96DRAFT_439766 [Choanephora cucurbitarum]|nr:hypothetical protein EDC96DRAFT_439766 [Choanephora cucurbitarum]
MDVESNPTIKEESFEVKLEHIEPEAPADRRPESTSNNALDEGEEDIFTRENIEKWQAARIRAWSYRHTVPDCYYFRLLLPGEIKRNGPWSPEEHEAFMKRYKEWISNGYRLGSFWGIFSLAVPHRVGYQCMGYYRRLLASGKLKDDSYVFENGKLKLVGKRQPYETKTLSVEGLGSEWETEKVKELEKKVDALIQEFHGTHLQGATSKRTAKPAAKVKSTTNKQTAQIGKLIRRMASSPLASSPSVSKLESEPEIADLRRENWKKEWYDRLAEYKEFLE